MSHYYQASARVTECYECGENVMCEIQVAEYPDPETGYIDERAICEACKNGHPFYESNKERE